MARVLITGATGLLGRWVAAHWSTGDERVSVSHTDHDLTDSQVFMTAIRRSRPDLVLHLAWCASGSPAYRTSPNNARWADSSFEAAEYCLDRGIRFLATGTVADDGSQRDPYSLAKQDLRARLEPAITSGAIGWIRPFYVFDPVALRPALIAEATAALRSDRPVTLKSPFERHDFIHASDVGAALVEVIRHDLRGVIDVGTGESRSVVDVVEACGARWAVVEPPGAPGNVAVADSQRLRMVGWEPAATDEFFGAE